MNPMQDMAAKAAIRNMLGKGRVDICAIRKILEMTGGVPAKEDMQVLELLHCVDFSELDTELLRGLPCILQRVLASEGVTFEFSTNHRRMLLHN